MRKIKIPSGATIIGIHAKKDFNGLGFNFISPTAHEKALKELKKKLRLERRMIKFRRAKCKSEIAKGKMSYCMKLVEKWCLKDQPESEQTIQCKDGMYTFMEQVYEPEKCKEMRGEDFLQKKGCSYDRWGVNTPQKVAAYKIAEDIYKKTQHEEKITFCQEEKKYPCTDKEIADSFERRKNLLKGFAAIVIIVLLMILISIYLHCTKKKESEYVPCQELSQSPANQSPYMQAPSIPAPSIPAPNVVAPTSHHMIFIGQRMGVPVQQQVPR